MSPQQYSHLLDTLSDASLAWFAPAGLTCETEDDPDWPAPQNFPEANQLMSELPDVAQFVCGLTAAEMALPLWEDYAQTYLSDDLTPQQIALPRHAIIAANHYLQGTPTSPPVQSISEQIRDLAQQDIIEYGTVGFWALEATPVGTFRPASLAHNAARAYANSRAHAHQAYADRLEQYRPFIGRYERHLDDLRARRINQAYTFDYLDFMARWWEICRCRLAFQIEGAQLEV